MKKALSSLVLLSLLGLILIPGIGLAATEVKTKCVMSHTLTGMSSVNCPLAGVDCSFDSGLYDCGMCCTLDAVYTVVDWIFVLLMAMVAIMVIWGGVSIATAGGDTEKVNKGRSYIMYAAIGLAVALLSRAIPSIVIALVG